MGHQTFPLPTDGDTTETLPLFSVNLVNVHPHHIASDEVNNQERISYEDISKFRWEDEGGTYTSCSHPAYRINSMSPLQTHIDKATAHLSESKYDEAVAELKSAAERYKDYTATMETAFSSALRELSSPGCPATPPHPKTIELVRIGRSYRT